MEQQELKQIQVNTVGMTKIEGAGDFSCPDCEVTISLEDETESVHSVLETNVRNVSSYWEAMIS